LAADLAERLVGGSQEKEARKLLVDLHWGGTGSWKAANLERGMMHWLALHPQMGQRLSAIYQSAMDLIRRGKPGAVASILELFEITHRGQNLTSPRDEYLQIYVIINEGDKLNTSGQASQAREKYETALTRLEKLKNENPEWEPTIVKYRARYLNDKLAGLKSVKRAEKPPTVIAGSVAPTALEFPADLKIFRAVSRLMADRHVPKSWNWATPSYFFPWSERFSRYLREPSGGKLTLSSGHLEIHEKSGFSLGRSSPRGVADLWEHYLQWSARLLAEEESGWYRSFVRSMDSGEKAVNLRWLQAGVSRVNEAGQDLVGLQSDQLSLGGVGGALLVSRLSENPALTKGLMARLEDLESKELKEIQKKERKKSKKKKKKEPGLPGAYEQIRSLGESPDFAPKWWREKGEISFGWAMSGVAYPGEVLALSQHFPFRQGHEFANRLCLKSFLRTRPDLVLKVGRISGNGIRNSG